MAENIFPPKIKFYQNHRPTMDAGEYSITIDGAINHPKITQDHTTGPITQYFAVYGERFALNEQDISAVFPAAGSTGDYASILPHLILKRNTLPWERHANKNNKELPWLALLLFDETEVPEKKIISVKDLGLSAQEKEKAQHEDDQLTVIDVSETLLKKILPSTNSLRLLAHTRQGVSKTDELVGEENAVLFCNRLPAQGTRSTIHLVSLEGKYNENGFDYAGGSSSFRLVSLKSWEFYATEHFKITTDTLTALQGKASTTDLEKLSTLLDREFAGTEDHFVKEILEATGLVTDSFKKILIDNAKFNKTFDGLLLHLNKDILTLRLPAGASTEPFLSQGLVPLVHYFRNGDRSVSWYRSPFLPYHAGAATDGSAIHNLHPEGADELLQFDANLGMFDVSYSAAWEIGRLLALANKDFSVSLFRWKRLLAQHGHKAMQLASYDHLPVFAQSHDHAQEQPLWEKHLQPWLTQLASFQSLPANYLLPDEALLPQESIRFFEVDKNWQIATLSGAFSVGGTWDKESQSDDNAFNDFLKLQDTYLIGFLLRSDVVNGWPGLLIDGVDATGNTVKPLLRKLSKNVLLCLFKKVIKQVVFHQKPELMHFGLINKGDNLFSKSIRDKDGNENGGEVAVKWQSGTTAEERVVDMAQLAIDLGKANQPAAFAMNMVEGIPSVVFNIA